MMMMIIIIIITIVDLAPFFYCLSRSRKNAKYTAFSLAWGISCEKDKSSALFWSSPLNVGARENPKGTELD